jgi:hypothetical protein
LFTRAICQAVGSKTSDDRLDDVSFAFTIGVTVEEAIDTSSTESSSGNALTFFASPSTRFLAAANSFNYTCNDGGFGGLLPLSAILLAVTSITATLFRGTTVASTTTAWLRTAANLVCNGGGYSSKTQVFEDFASLGFATFTAGRPVIVVWVVVIVVSALSASVTVAAIVFVVMVIVVIATVIMRRARTSRRAVIVAIASASVVSIVVFLSLSQDEVSVAVAALDEGFLSLYIFRLSSPGRVTSVTAVVIGHGSAR